MWSTGSLRSYPTATSCRGTFTASDDDDGAGADRDLDATKAAIPHAQRRLRLSDDIILDVSLRSDIAANPGQRVRSGRKGPGVTRSHDASIVGSAGGQVWLQVDGVRGLVPCSTDCFDSLPPTTASAATATASAMAKAEATAEEDAVPATVEVPSSVSAPGPVHSRADVCDGDTAAAAVAAAVAAASSGMGDRTSSSMSGSSAGPEEGGDGGTSPTKRLGAESSGARTLDGATSPSSMQVSLFY